MVILRTEVGPKRIELQKGAIILPTETWEGLSTGRRQMITNAQALQFSVISWTGHSLDKITSAAAYKGAFAQYQVRIKQELDIDVPDLALIGL